MSMWMILYSSVCFLNDRRIIPLKLNMLREKRKKKLEEDRNILKIEKLASRFIFQS